VQGQLSSLDCWNKNSLPNIKPHAEYEILVEQEWISQMQLGCRSEHTLACICVRRCSHPIAFLMWMMSPAPAATVCYYHSVTTGSITTDYKQIQYSGMSVIKKLTFSKTRLNSRAARPTMNWNFRVSDLYHNGWTILYIHIFLLDRIWCMSKDNFWLSSFGPRTLLLVLLNCGTLYHHHFGILHSHWPHSAAGYRHIFSVWPTGAHSWLLRLLEFSAL